jgi:hypothetical protein
VASVAHENDGQLQVLPQSSVELDRHDLLLLVQRTDNLYIESSKTLEKALEHCEER